MAEVTDVDARLDLRAHPLRSTLDELRGAILSVSPDIVERWKWNAPSCRTDSGELLTFMLRRDDELLLVVHHPEAPAVTSPLFEPDPKDARRFIRIRAGDHTATVIPELRRVVEQLVALGEDDEAGGPSGT